MMIFQSHQLKGENQTQVVADLLKLIRFDKPIGTLLLLWPCLIALFAASKSFVTPTYTLLAFILGAFVMRSAGCVINDIADKDFDGHVKRTQARPLATGRLTASKAWVLFVFLIAIAGTIALTLKPGTLLLSLGALFLACLYPWVKRWSNYPQVVLSMAFSWSVFMAYYEVLGVVDSNAWILWLAMCCWVVAYDTTYAMVDRDDDLRIGIKSTAIAFGKYDGNIILILQLVSTLLMILFGYMNEYNALYYSLIVLSFTYFYLVIYKSKICTRKRDNCFLAFLANNNMGALMFMATLLSTL